MKVLNKIVFVLFTILFFLNNIKSQSLDELPCKCIDYTDTFYYAPKYENIDDVYGSVSNFQKTGSHIIRQFTLNTSREFAYKVSEPCFTLDIAPCRDEDIYANISGDLYYNRIKTKIIQINIGTKSCALIYDSLFISQLNNQQKPIIQGRQTPATFLVKSPLIEICNKNEIIIYDQKIYCSSNYLFTKNNVILQLTDFTIDLHKKQNLKAVIDNYEKNLGLNKKRVKPLISKKKLNQFTGIYSNNASLQIPIDTKSELTFNANELLIGNYFFAAVLSIQAELVDDSIFQIEYSNSSFNLTPKIIQSYFEKLNIQTGNFYYNSSLKQLIFDIYYEQKY